ncbi:IS66 family transposase [Candidatus Woesearchaeota archaeon]|nr:IS66 family transposase [Candidatus Woesearchaeota archaeon]
MILRTISKELSKKSKKEIIDEYIELYLEKEKLEKELKKYKNPHTPSSKNSFDKPQAQGLRVGRKEGKKSGHKGKTRAKDAPNNTVEVTTDFNPKTGNKNIKPTGYVEEVTITDFEIVKVVTKYNCHEYRDLNTGEIFIARHKDMPKRGIFGKNVLALASYLRFEGRVVFDKIASIFANVFDISMTTPTAMDICTRVAEKAKPQYEILKKKVREEKTVNGDETSANRNGLPSWLWGFFSLTIALFVFNQKRGGDIIERILGKNFKGVLGSDGWSTYKVFCEEFGILLQRCWAHAIREVKEVCMNSKRKDKSLEFAYKWFCDIFEQVKEARKIKSQEMREQLYVELIEELDRWIQVYSTYRTLRKTVNMIKNGKEYWFTCVLYPEIEPTNNLAERMLRSWIVFRKIIGCLRTEKGEQTTETMLSLFGTWKLRGLHPHIQLKSLLGA